MRTATTVEFTADATTFEVTVRVEAVEIHPDRAETVLAKREWTRTIPRHLA